MWFAIAIGIPAALLWFLGMTPAHKIAVLCFLCTFQVFISSGLPNLTIIVSLLIVIEFGMRTVPRLSLVLYILALVSLTSALWSSSPGGAYVNALYFFTAGGLIAAGHFLRMTQRENFDRTIIFPFLAAGSVLAALVVLFRIFPAWEINFFRSPIAKVFINPSVVDGLFAGAPNNALADDKAGAFFVNANVASVYLGVVLLLSAYMATRYLTKSLYVVSTLAGVGVISTGSKTGLGILIIVVLLLVLRWARGRLVALILAIIVPVGFFFASIQLVEQLQEAEFSTTSRLFLWQNAVSAILESPLLGLGYGGWEARMSAVFSAVGSANNYPPHNMFLAYWVYSGVATVVLLVVAIFLTFRILVRGPRPAFYAVLAFGWTVLHAMGDNTGYLVDWHVMPVMALFIGFSHSTGSTLDLALTRPTATGAAGGYVPPTWPRLVHRE
ncbi:O-antigen ligase family protein [Microbacterium sp.]|uniref:O-antigen ligase family protein n=1 Tax=Microbacterium sp. TaxID=51671 RepID=UPI0032428514